MWTVEPRQLCISVVLDGDEDNEPAVVERVDLRESEEKIIHCILIDVLDETRLRIILGPDELPPYPSRRQRLPPLPPGPSLWMQQLQDPLGLETAQEKGPWD